MEEGKTKKSRFKKYILLLLFFVIALGTAGYFGIQKYGNAISEMGIFTKYPEREVMDTILTAIDTSSKIPIESVPINIDTKIDTVKIIPIDTLKMEDSIMVGMVKPIEKERPIVKETPKVEDTIARKAPVLLAKEDLFDDLLPEKTQIEGDSNAFLNLYKKDILSSKALFKLAAIAGKKVLLNQSQDMFEIFEILEMEDEIEGLLLYDRKGRIIYATNTKFKNAFITTVLPEWQFEGEGLNWIAKDGKIITGIPIYSTYGRLGTVLISTLESTL